MKGSIFTPSNSFNLRGPQQLALPKAGFFYASSKGILFPYKTAACLYRVLRSTLPAKVDCLTAVFGGPSLFPPANVKQSHHAHHRQAIRTADYPCPLSRTRRKDGRRTSSAVSAILPGPRKVGPCRGQNLPLIVTRVTPLFFSFSLTYGELFTVKIPVLCLTLTIG